MWVYGYDIETKQQSSQWKSPVSPCPKKAWQVHSQVKAMLLVFSIIEVLRIMNSLLKVRLSRYLSGGYEMSAWCGMKKVTWNVDCRKVTPPSWHCSHNIVN
jgi:hypothetical protein